MKNLSLLGTPTSYWKVMIDSQKFLQNRKSREKKYVGGVKKALKRQNELILSKLAIRLLSKLFQGCLFSV